MATPRVVKALDVVEDIGPGLVTGAICLVGCRSVLGEEKKRSMAALSQTLPVRLTEPDMPLSAVRRWNGSLV